MDCTFRVASADGTKVFFETQAQLVPADTDSSIDVYERNGGTTTLVSKGSINGNGADDAFIKDVSSDGSRVFFTTTEQLAGTDLDSNVDIYERSGETTTQVSQGAMLGNGPYNVSFAGASSDGSTVFFTTAEALTPGDTDPIKFDVYERSGGTTTQVSTDTAGNAGGASDASFAGASSDGSTVFFTTTEQLAATDNDSQLDIYARSGGTTTQVSTNTAGTANGTYGAAFDRASSDGTKVYFSTYEKLATTDTDSQDDIYQRAGTTTSLVSTNTTGTANGPNNAVFDGSSSDGSKVFFETYEQLAGTDTDSRDDVYERAAGATTQVSQSAINGNGIYDSFFDGASSDGSKVFFETDEQLAGTDTDSQFDIYERAAGVTTQVSTNTAGNANAATFASFSGASSDGTKIFFSTTEPLATTDTDSQYDVYERLGGTTAQVSTNAAGSANGANVANFMGASSDGTRVFFETDEQLVAADTDSSSDVYERSEGITTLISTGNPPDTTINAATINRTKRKAKFRFSASEPGSTFLCKLDKEAFTACSSPKTYRRLKVGRHKFRVEAKAAMGNIDPTPAIKRFKI